VVDVNRFYPDVMLTYERGNSPDAERSAGSPYFHLPRPRSKGNKVNFITLFATAMLCPAWNTRSMTDLLLLDTEWDKEDPFNEQTQINGK